MSILQLIEIPVTNAKDPFATVAICRVSQRGKISPFAMVGNCVGNRPGLVRKTQSLSNVYRASSTQTCEDALGLPILAVRWIAPDLHRDCSNNGSQTSGD